MVERRHELGALRRRQPELGDVRVVDAVRRQGLRQYIEIELRVGARAWDRAHVHEQRHIRGSRQRHELIDRSVGMSNRKECRAASGHVEACCPCAWRRDRSCRPKRSARGHRADFDALKAQIEQLQTEVTNLETEKGAIEAIAAGHRADFERERERGDKLMRDTMTLASVAMSAQAKAAQLEGERAARRSQFWMKLRARRWATGA